MCLIVAHCAEAANGGVLQIIVKLDIDARRLNKLEDYLLRCISGSFNGFYQNFSCRTHQNSATKSGNRKMGLKFHKYSCRTPHFLPDRLKFVNYVKNSCIEHFQSFPGVKHRENTYLVCTARWLLSIVPHCGSLCLIVAHCML